MREYEFVYILHPDLTPEREQEIHDRFQQVLTQNEAVYLLTDDWGKRKLAYEIQKLQKGHYFLLSFLGSGTFIPELERIARLDPDILRFLSVLVSKSVTDIEGRLAKAKVDREEQAKRREEREKQEAERAAQAAARPSVPRGESNFGDRDREGREDRGDDSAPPTAAPSE